LESRQLSGDGTWHGRETARAKAIFGKANATRMNLHEGVNAEDPASHVVHAAG
jgi:hypothetical protein